MKRSTVPHQIIGSFEDIGKSILTETAKVPVDLAKTVLDGSKVNAGNQTENSVPYGDGKPMASESAKSKAEQLSKQAINSTFAREALRRLTVNPEQKELSVFDQKNRDEEQKKQIKADELEKSAGAALPVVSTKRKTGDPHAAKAKQTGAERKVMGTE